MGGTDLNLSASVSSSATSGAQLDQKSYFGDFIVGRGARGKTEGLPPWAMVAIVGAAVVVLTIFLVRK